MTHRSWAEPYKIKMVEPIRMTTASTASRPSGQPGTTRFLLRSEDVYIDLLTDSGTSAMSDYQWAGLMLGDEAYAGSKSFYHLVERRPGRLRLRRADPDPPGRGAEHILSQILIKDGRLRAGQHVLHNHPIPSGTCWRHVCRRNHRRSTRPDQPASIQRQRRPRQTAGSLIDEVGADKIPYISVETNVNMAGGQPMSMANLKATASSSARSTAFW